MYRIFPINSLFDLLISIPIYNIHTYIHTYIYIYVYTHKSPFSLISFPFRNQFFLLGSWNQPRIFDHFSISRGSWRLIFHDFSMIFPWFSHSNSPSSALPSDFLPPRPGPSLCLGPQRRGVRTALSALSPKLGTSAAREETTAVGLWSHRGVQTRAPGIHMDPPVWRIPFWWLQHVTPIDNHWRCNNIWYCIWILYIYIYDYMIYGYICGRELQIIKSGEVLYH